MFKLLPATVGLTAFALAAPALAERTASHEQREALSGALEALGVASWDDLKLEDEGYWAIDDAHMADGTCADLKISEADFTVLERQMEDCANPSS